MGPFGWFMLGAAAGEQSQRKDDGGCCGTVGCGCLAWIVIGFLALWLTGFIDAMTGG